MQANLLDHTLIIIMFEENTKLFIFFFLIASALIIPFSICLQTDTIDAALILKDPQTIRSAANHFTLGFFTPNATNKRYLGVWYTISPATVTWVANRDAPLPDSRGSLSLSSSGSLVLTDGENRIIWSTDAPPRSTNATAQLLDSGNLILKDATTAAVLWESYRHPADSFVPSMRVSYNPRTGERVSINSWRAANDPGRGNFTAGLNTAGIPQTYIWRNDGVAVWRSGPWNGRILTGVTNMYSSFVDGFSFGVDEDGTYYFTMNSRRNSITRYHLSADGGLAEATWNEKKSGWDVGWTAPANDCDHYNKCGPFASCFAKDKPICSCLKGYEPRERGEWEKGKWKGGCVKREKLRCDNNNKGKGREDGFAKMSFVKVPDFMEWMSVAAERDCSSTCLRNCTCVAYAYDPGIGCMYWGGDLIDVQKFEGDAGIDFYVRVAYSEIGQC